MTVQGTDKYRFYCVTRRGCGDRTKSSLGPRRHNDNQIAHRRPGSAKIFARDLEFEAPARGASARFDRADACAIGLHANQRDAGVRELSLIDPWRNENIEFRKRR